MKTKKFLVISTIVFFVVLFFVGTYFYKTSEKKKLGFLASENAEIFIRDHSPTIGTNEAEVFLIEFMDPECETCRDFYPYIKQLMSEYPGKIKLVLRYAPFHGNAKTAVRIIEAARLQGKYWETLELLFKYQPQWGSHRDPRPDLIWTYLTEIDVNIDEIKKNMDNLQITNIIEQDVKDSIKLGVRKTPQFFINGKPLMDFGYDQLRNAIVAEFKD